MLSLFECGIVVFWREDEVPKMAEMHEAVTQAVMNKSLGTAIKSACFRDSPYLFVLVCHDNLNPETVYKKWRSQEYECHRPVPIPIGYWKGRPLDDLTKEELVEAIVTMDKLHKDEIQQLWESAR